MRFRFIELHRTEFAVVTMCRVLAVSKAGYYAWRDRPRSARAMATTALVRVMREVHAESDQTDGSPRMHRELIAQGYACSENRVARVMRAERIHAKQRRRFRITTDSAHAAPTAPNILARQFAVKPRAHLNAIWVADITFIPTREGWLYLAVVLDLHSRRVVGWAMHATLQWELVGDALTMAVAHRRPPPGLLHHSDRGLQYACEKYRTLLQRHRMTVGMSRAGDCWDNAVAESFFATLKAELVSDATWATRAEAQRALFRYIEMWYNRRRRHSSIGYLSPVDFERTTDAVA